MGIDVLEKNSQTSACLKILLWCYLLDFDHEELVIFTHAVSNWNLSLA